MARPGWLLAYCIQFVWGKIPLQRVLCRRSKIRNTEVRPPLLRSALLRKVVGLIHSSFCIERLFMVTTQDGDATFFEKVKHLQGIGDLFDLRNMIEGKVKDDGVDGIIVIVDKVVEAIAEVPHDIPLITELLNIVFEYAKLNDEIMDRVLSKFSKYTITRDQEQIRNVALNILSEYRPKQIAPQLINIARDQTESQSIRKKALHHLRKADPENAHLSLLLEIFERHEKEYMELVMDVLERHYRYANFKETQSRLQEISRHQEISIPIRCRAIELLGIFGDIDIIERMCLLSENDPKIHEALQKMLLSLITKPINILGIGSENFEYLINQWLIRINYSEVSVTRNVRDDGVDVVAYRQGGVSNKRYKVIVQCKRYATSPVDIDVVEKLVESVKNQQAKEGILVTTSTFSQRAKEFAKNHQYLELIDRNELQQQLNMAFGENHYCIINRS